MAKVVKPRKAICVRHGLLESPLRSKAIPVELPPAKLPQPDRPLEPANCSSIRSSCSVVGLFEHAHHGLLRLCLPQELHKPVILQVPRNIL
jgi:hypothetical protein